MVGAIALIILVFAAIGFVLAPLLRSEDDLQSIRRPRPGTRHLHGAESVDIDTKSDTQRHCPHCGAPVGEGYDFCGQCTSPLL